MIEGGAEPGPSLREESMNASFKAALYALGGIAIGAAGGRALYAEGNAIPAYYVAEVDVHNMDTYKTYASQVTATLAPYGGQYLAAGGRTQGVEGTLPPNRVAILQFPSMDKAQAWYNSPEYGKIKPIRHSAATTRSYIVEGRSVAH
jgi:uncharacterized protein (DUF1330 family)